MTFGPVTVTLDYSLGSDTPCDEILTWMIDQEIACRGECFDCVVENTGQYLPCLDTEICDSNSCTWEVKRVYHPILFWTLEWVQTESCPDECPTTCLKPAHIPGSAEYPFGYVFTFTCFGDGVPDCTEIKIWHGDCPVDCDQPCGYIVDSGMNWASDTGSFDPCPEGCECPTDGRPAPSFPGEKWSPVGGCEAVDPPCGGEGCGDCGCASYEWECDEGSPMGCEGSGTWGPGDLSCSNVECDGVMTACNDPGEPAFPGTVNGQIEYVCCTDPC